MRLSIVFCIATLTARAQVSDFKDADFRRADSIARLYPNHSLKSLPDLAFKLTSSLSGDAEKFRALFTWVCLNISSDYELYVKNKKGRESCKSEAELSEWYARLRKELFQKLLKDRTTICTGYAYLVRELALAVGIECVIIDGYGRPPGSKLKRGFPNHNWNAVKLNGKWYLCDPAWASGRIDRVSKEFVVKFNVSFFLAEPESFSKNHYPVDIKWLLVESIKQSPDSFFK
jgi:transglutaminase/protease-like cytokinesis protein 3